MQIARWRHDTAANVRSTDRCGTWVIAHHRLRVTKSHRPRTVPRRHALLQTDINCFDRVFCTLL